MYDQLAGGFARYSVDAEWLVPHFEKMLYDNALLLRVYLHWWRQTGSEWRGRWSRRPPSSCSPRCAPRRAVSPRRWTLDSEGREGGVLRVDAGAASYLTAAITCGEFLRDHHLQQGRLLRVSRDGLVGPHAGVLEDYACVAKAFGDLAAATGDAAWLDHAQALLDTVLADFAAPDGGFFDTAAGAEVLIVRPRDLGDNASPSGHSAMIHACLTYAALTGSTQLREVAERAIGMVRDIAQQSPRFAGHSLAAAATALDGPLEIAIIGAPGAKRDALVSTTNRIAPAGSVLVVAEAGESQIPLLLDRGEIDGLPTAYVCRQMVCQRPVTDPAELADLIGRD
jgi:uncharacterized protein YyaL (SSP411 family)